MVEPSKKVYILVTKTPTLFSRIIGLATHSPYTHVSVSADGPAGPFYSFGRIYPMLPLPAGFIDEAPDRGYYSGHPEALCQLYELEVGRPEYNRLRHFIKQMMAGRKQYKYNLLGVLGCFFGKPYCAENRYFCSQFVAEALQKCGILELTLPPALVKPKDFLNIECAKLIYSGSVAGLLLWKWGRMEVNENLTPAF